MQLFCSQIKVFERKAEQPEINQLSLVTPEKKSGLVHFYFWPNTKIYDVAQIFSVIKLLLSLP